MNKFYKFHLIILGLEILDLQNKSRLCCKTSWRYHLPSFWIFRLFLWLFFCLNFKRFLSFILSKKRYFVTVKILKIFCKAVKKIRLLVSYSRWWIIIRYHIQHTSRSLRVFFSRSLPTKKGECLYRSIILLLHHTRNSCLCLIYRGAWYKCTKLIPDMCRQKGHKFKWRKMYCLYPCMTKVCVFA